MRRYWTKVHYPWSRGSGMLPASRSRESADWSIVMNGFSVVLDMALPTAMFPLDAEPTIATKQAQLKTRASATSSISGGMPLPGTGCNT